MDAPIAKITNVNIGIRSGMVIITSGKIYYPIEVDESVEIVAYQTYRVMPMSERYFVDYIVGNESDLQKIQKGWR